ncbi:MAG TPA: hypothetical protein VFF44_13690 [Casimicrobiaceae bacterium]|nr:hypothetical protein [Casimicrobiaceae bacterium]
MKFVSEGNHPGRYGDGTVAPLPRLYLVALGAPSFDMLSFDMVLCFELFFLVFFFFAVFLLSVLAVGAVSLLAAGAGAGVGAGAGAWAPALSDTAKALAISADINLFIFVLLAGGFGEINKRHFSRVRRINAPRSGRLTARAAGRPVSA